jgi:cytoskeleton protein RodZ
MDRYNLEELGQRLKTQREEKGFSLRAIADRTRIPLSVLESLEAGDNSHLPAPVFVKGFLRSYAIEIGLKPEEVIGDYKLSNPEPDRSVVVPVTARPNLDKGSRVFVWLPLVLLVIVVGAGVYFVMPYLQTLSVSKPVTVEEGMGEDPKDMRDTADSDASLSPSLLPSSETIEPRTTGVVAPVPPVVEPPSQVASIDDTARSNADTDAVDSTPPVDYPATTEDVSTSVPTEETPASPSAGILPPVDEAEGPHELKLDFSDDVWVQVIIDGDETQHGLFGAGMTKSWQADKKISLRIGNAGGVRVFFDGQDLGIPGESGKVVELILPKNLEVQ